MTTPLEVLNNICEYHEKLHKQMYDHPIGNISYQDENMIVNDHNEIFKKDPEGKWYYYASAHTGGQIKCK